MGNIQNLFSGNKETEMEIRRGRLQESLQSCGNHSIFYIIYRCSLYIEEKFLNA